MKDTPSLCLNCAETEAQAAREQERLARENHFLEQEREAALQRVLELEFHNRRLESDNYRLRTKGEESQGKRNAREADEIKEWLHAWDDRRMMIPGAKKLRGNSLSPSGSYATCYKRARKLGEFSHEDMMACIKGASISEWHTAELDRFKVRALIAGDPEKRDDKIRAHIARWERYELLVEGGFPHELAVKSAQREPVLASVPKGEWSRCPGCGSPAACWSGCPASGLEAA